VNIYLFLFEKRGEKRMTYSDLPGIEAHLNTLGLGALLTELQRGDLRPGNMELPFTSIQTARMVAALLYRWLTYYPRVKQMVSLSVSRTVPVLTVKVRTTPETRGRRGSRL